MRTIVTTLLAVSVSLGVLASDARPSPRADALVEAAAVLEKVAAAYRNAPVITDRASMVFRAGGREQQSELEYVLGRGGDAYLHMNGMATIAVGGSVYLTKDDVSTKYLKVDLDGNLFDTFRKAFG